MVRNYLLVGGFLMILLLVEPYLPFVLAVSGVLAMTWFIGMRGVLAVAFIAGLIIDLYWGRPLGLSSLVLLVTAAAAAMVHEHFPQWWALGLSAVAASLAWSWWFNGKISLLTVLGCTIMTLGWYGLNWYMIGKHRGVYLKR